MTTRRAIVTGGVAAACLASRAAKAGGKPRILSLSLCIDTILIEVAERRQIVALTHYARDPQGSTIAPLARTLPFTHETAEEIAALRPDLVLASRHTAAPTRNALRRMDIRTEAFDRPKTVAASLEQVRAIAGLAGNARLGERLVERIEAAVAAATSPRGVRPVRAVIYQSNGLTAGPGTLADDLLTVAGFQNGAGRYGLKGWARVPLEQLLADPPEVLFVGEAAPGARTWADRIMTHPALSAIGVRMRLAPLPERLLYCGGPVIIEALALMARAR